VNKFPDFVRHIVQRLKVLCPVMGKKRIAETLARAGLHLAATTAGRMLKAKPTPPVEPRDNGVVSDETGRIVTARAPNHVWHVDLTIVPTRAGFWAPWFPFALLQVWPFAYWVAVIVDHFSRKVMGFAVFEKQPSSSEVRAFLGRAIRRDRPRHLLSDRGSQFDCAAFRNWAKRKRIKVRYGAVGKYGSIAIIERFIRSMKSECTGRILVPLRLHEMRGELAAYVAWYNEHRPHQGLHGGTPGESDADIVPLRPQFETRGKHGVKLKLKISYVRGRTHLPIVELKNAA
jgi:putative transposase